MADVELYDPITRDILIYDEEDVPAVLAGSQMRPPTDEERREYDDRKALEGNKLLAGAEQVAGAATFGLVDKLAGTDEDAAARKRAMEREHPAISFGTTVAGAAVPTVLAGAVTGPAGAAVGLGRAGTAAARVLAEGAAGGLAEAAEGARQTDEAIDYWNALAWGIGGSVLGHGLASLTRRGAVVADNVLARAERQALETDAKAVRRGAGSAADAGRSADQVIDQASAQVSINLEQVAARVEQLRRSIPTRRLDDLVAGPSPALDDWASQMAADIRQELTRREAEALSLQPAPRQRSAAPVESQSDAAKRVLAEIRSELKPGTEARANARVREGYRTKTKTTRRGTRIERDPLSPEAEARADRRFLKSADLTDQERAAYEALEPGLDRQRWRERFRLDSLAQHFAIGRRQLDAGVGTYSTEWGAINDATQVLGDAASDPVDIWRAAQSLTRELPDSPTRAKLRQGLEDPTLFGRAAQLAERLNSAGQIRSFRQNEIREMLAGDAAMTRAARAELDATLDSIDGVIAAHREFGVGKVDDLEKLRDTIRREIASADKARVARSAADVPQASTPSEATPSLTQRASGILGDLAKDRLAGAVVGAALGGVPGAAAGVAAQVARDALGRVIRNMSGAQRAAVARAARGFVSRSARTTPPVMEATGPGGLATLMDRFIGDYPDEQASYQAKIEALKAAATDPSILPRVLAASFGELPIHYPRAFTNASAQLTRALAFLAQNLPTSELASILSPRGLPPSYEAIREFAVLWTAATEPETVLEAVEEGGALPLQVEALKVVHPGMYQQLRQDIISEIAKAPELVDTQTKIQLDILFETDGLAGLAYTWEAARLFRETPEPEFSPGRPIIQETLPREPRGIAAAKNGPTMG